MQVLLNQFSKSFRFQNLAFGSEAQDPAFHFIEAGNLEGDFQASVGEPGDLLAFVPDFLPYPSGPAGGDSDLYRVKLIMHDLEAVLHEIVQCPHAKAQSAARFARGSLHLREKTKA